VNSFTVPLEFVDCDSPLGIAAVRRALPSNPGSANPGYDSKAAPAPAIAHFLRKPRREVDNFDLPLQSEYPQDFSIVSAAASKETWPYLPVS
jgi:hypothetical protein